MEYIILRQAVLLMHAVRYPTQVMGIVEAGSEAEALGAVAGWQAGERRRWVAVPACSCDGQREAQARRMGRPARVGVAVTVGGDRHLFVPRWFGWAPSARTVNSGQVAVAHGTIVPKADQLERQRSIEAARAERKADMRRRQYAGRAMVDRMDAKAERRAAREAKRIMMERRAQCIAAFADIDTTEV